MSRNGVRKRLKVRWMRHPEDQDAHAFLILTGGTLKEYALCGLPLVSMHLWTKDEKHRDPCAVCKAAMGRGSRA